MVFNASEYADMMEARKKASISKHRSGRSVASGAGANSSGSSALLVNGVEVKESALVAKGREATQSVGYGMVGHTRGMSKETDPARMADDLELDRESGRWFRMVRGKREYV